MNTKSPYRPPAARVADSPAGDRPGAVKLALWSIALFVLVGCYHQLANLTEVNNGEMSALAWIVGWIEVVAIVATGILIAKGRGWARWVLFVLALREIWHLLDALTFLSMFDGDGYGEFFGTLTLVMLPLGSVFAVGATILVFGPGRGWFR